MNNSQMIDAERNERQFAALYDSEPNMKSALICLRDMKKSFRDISAWAKSGATHFSEAFYLPLKCEAMAGGILEVLRNYWKKCSPKDSSFSREIDNVKIAFENYMLLKRGDIGRRDVASVDWQCAKRLLESAGELWATQSSRRSIDELCIMRHEELVSVSKEVVDVVSSYLRLYVASALDKCDAPPCFVSPEFVSFLRCLKNEFGVRNDYYSKIRLVRAEGVAERLSRRCLSGSSPVFESWMLESF